MFTAETNDDQPAGVSTAPIARAEPFSWWQLGVAPDEAERLLDNAVVGSFVIYDDTSRDNRFVLAHRPAAGPGVEGDGIERLYIGWVVRGLWALRSCGTSRGCMSSCVYACSCSVYGCVCTYACVCVRV